MVKSNDKKSLARSHLAVQGHKYRLSAGRAVALADRRTFFDPLVKEGGKTKPAVLATLLL